MAVRPKYKCSQDEFYEVACAGWQAYTDELPSFTALKALYTPAFATTRTTAIDNAEALPDHQARGAEAVTFNPQQNATVSMQQEGQPAITLQTDAAGVVGFDSLPVGNYTLTVTLATFQTSTASVKITTGVHSRRKITLSH